MTLVESLPGCLQVPRGRRRAARTIGPASRFGVFPLGGRAPACATGCWKHVNYAAGLFGLTGGLIIQIVVAIILSGQSAVWFY